MGQKRISHRLLIPPPPPHRLNWDPRLSWYVTIDGGVRPDGKRPIDIMDPQCNEIVGRAKPAKASANLHHLVGELFEHGEPQRTASTLVKDGVLNSVLHELNDHAEVEYLTAEDVQKLWQLKGHKPAGWELRALERGGVFPLVAGATIRRLVLQTAIGSSVKFALMSGLIDDDTDPDFFAEKAYSNGNSYWARHGLRQIFELLNGPVGRSGRKLIDL